MSQLKNVYCANCRRFLGQEDLRKGIVLFKCPNCGRMTQVSVELVVDASLDKRKAKPTEWD